MYSDISAWLDKVFEDDIPSDVKAICFNLYDDGDNNWALEAVGTSRFDPEDQDWGCDEVTDFDTRDNPYEWNEESSWEEVLSTVYDILKRYIEEGEQASVIRKLEGAGVGFIDGELALLYTRES